MNDCIAEHEDDPQEEFPSSIAIIGAGGNMGTAMVEGIQRNFKAAKSDKIPRIIASSPRATSMTHLKISDSDKLVDNSDAASRAEMIILSVKPHIAPKVLQEIRDVLTERRHHQQPILVSVAAGLSLKDLSNQLGRECGHVGVIRCMPNPASEVGYGCTALCAAEGVSEEMISKAENVFKCMGIVERMEERTFAGATAVGGCGIAYVFMMAEALADAGVKYGLSRQTALRMAGATMRGAGHLMESGTHPAILRNKVESPGGVTIAATSMLEEKGLRSAIGCAVDSAVERIAKLENS